MTKTADSEQPKTVLELIEDATKLQAESARYNKLAENASKRVTFYLEHGAAISTAARYVAEKASKAVGGGASASASAPAPPVKRKASAGNGGGVSLDPIDKTEWISPSEAQWRSGVNSGTACRAAAAGKFRTNGIPGRKHRFDAADFQRWVDSRKPQRSRRGKAKATKGQPETRGGVF